ncbi:drug efflux ABC transporter ATP-binding/permease protein [Streptococcus pneumoniae]|nr:drug efflux ABC transporter ATP-binding/permease protein [Streptococcus pneumoniae]
MNYLKFIKKTKLILMGILIFLSSFNGVLLSGIIVYAGSLNQTSSFSDVLRFGAISILGWSAIYISNYYLEVTEASITKDINVKIKQGYFREQYLSSEMVKDYSSIISVLSNDLRLIEENYFRQIFEIISSILLFIVSLSFMLYLNFLVSIIFIVLSALPIIVPVFMKKMLSNSANEYSNSNAEYTHIIKEIFNGFKTLKSYSVTKEIISLSDKKLDKLEDSTFNLKRSEVLSKLVAVLISGFCFLVPLVVGCYFVIYHKSLSFSELIGIFLANDKVLGPIQSIAYSLNKINTTKDLRKPFLKYLSGEKNFIDAEHDNNGLYTSSIDEIHMKDVVYSITPENKLSIDFSFKSPFRVLLTGTSGSGKTTILNLINGSLKPQKGYVNLLSHGKKSSDSIPTVDQTPYIFDTTIRENVTLFQNEYFSDDQIIEVLKKVNLYEELEKIDILNYQCGENGSNLSGGQKQKIALARALIRNNKVYLFDEISANLDNDNSNSIHDILLTYSYRHVGWHYLNTDTPLIPRGKGQYGDGEFDCGCIYSSAPVTIGDRTYFYYMGGNGQHTNFRETSLSRAYIEKDHFAYWDIKRPEYPGVLYTNGFIFLNDQVYLDADIAAGGFVTIELFENNHTPMEITASLEKIEDGRYQVLFSEPLPRTQTRLKISFKNAKIYAIEGNLDIFRIESDNALLRG